MSAETKQASVITITPQVLEQTQVAQELASLLGAAWTASDGTIVYFTPNLLHPSSWEAGGPTYNAVKRGDLHVLAAQNQEQGRYTAMAAVIRDGGYTEIGKVASSESGTGPLVVRAALRKVRELNQPGAVVDIAGNRTGMTTTLTKACADEDFSRLSLYVMPPIYGPEEYSWGCFGDYVLDNNYLVNGPLELSYPVDAPSPVRNVLSLIQEVNPQHLRVHEGAAPQRQLLSPVPFLEGKALALDILDTERIERYLHDGYNAYGVYPTYTNGEFFWRVILSNEPLPEIVPERNIHLRRDVQRMYTRDAQQLQLAQGIQAIKREI